MKVKEILASIDLRPSKSKGQNFLLNTSVSNSTVGFSALKKDSAVVEVGPGLGALTAELLHRTKKMAIIEIEKNDRVKIEEIFFEGNENLIVF